MNDFDREYLEEHKKFAVLRDKFNKVFDSEAGPRSEKIMTDFVKNFNELAKIFLKTNKKIEFYKESYNVIYIGGKAGISSRDYGGEGIEEKGLLPFFANLDKIDIKLQSGLSQYYYEKWLNFVTVFGGGVDLIINNSDSSTIDEIKRPLDTDIIVYSTMLSGKKSSRNSYSDDGDNENNKIVSVKAKNIVVGMESDQMYCKLEVVGADDINIDDVKSENDFFLFRDCLSQALEMEAEYREKEMKFVNDMKVQYDLFIQKAVPFLSLKDL
jgi:hypothetical protein